MSKVYKICNCVESASGIAFGGGGDSDSDSDSGSSWDNKAGLCAAAGTVSAIASNSPVPQVKVAGYVGVAVTTYYCATN